MALPLLSPKSPQAGARWPRPAVRRPRLGSTRRLVSLRILLTLLAPLALLSLFTLRVGAAAELALETRLLAEMAVQGTNAASLYRLGDVCHAAGAEGDKKAVERAEHYLRRLLALESTNAPALALLGSIYTMKGRDAFWPTTQLRLVREGNAFMDQAVQLAPEDLRTRLTRVFNNAHMPDFLGRTEIVRTDLAWLMDQAGKAPERFTLAERQELALQWGRQLKRMDRADEARTVWEAARSLAPASKHATEIAAELAKMR